MISLLVLILVVVYTMVLISYMLKSNKHSQWQEKMTNFECGFDSSHLSRLSFSLRFFIITIVFLVFDVEVAVLLPLPLTEHENLYPFSWENHFMIFMLLLGGLMYEWLQGALEWSWESI